uniref:Uncharacterized protein n=1 Tax=Timema genevievae TaxID=629358 RepID=A0A7R9PQT3_TIMGE|nr:unnamed protein product [Timema genevievae]
MDCYTPSGECAHNYWLSKEALNYLKGSLHQGFGVEYLPPIRKNSFLIETPFHEALRPPLYLTFSRANKNSYFLPLDKARQQQRLFNTVVPRSEYPLAPLPPTTTHVAGTITLPPTATHFAWDHHPTSHRDSLCWDHHPTSHRDSLCWDHYPTSHRDSTLLGPSSYCPTVTHIAGTITLPPPRNSFCWDHHPFSHRNSRCWDHYPTSHHDSTLLGLSSYCPTATHVAGTITLPSPETHFAGTITLSPTATHVAKAITLLPHLNSHYWNLHPTSPPQLSYRDFLMFHCDSRYRDSLLFHRD